MRIATWNVNSLSARLPRLLSWLASAEPDVVVLQETKLAQDAFPTAQLAEAGYESVHRGQGRWNGVAVLSRVGLADIETDLPGVPGKSDEFADICEQTDTFPDIPGRTDDGQEGNYSQCLSQPTADFTDPTIYHCQGYQ